MAYLDRSRLRDPLNLSSHFSYLAVLSWVNIALSAWLVAVPWVQRRREGGGAGTAGQRGRGPKGFRRPDERIHEDLCARMAAHPALDASEIDVRITDGDVVLDGTVRSRSERRLAEAMAESVGGVRDIRNNLRLAQDAESPRRITSITGTEGPSSFPGPRSAPLRP
jgi:hypothetical protein